MRKYRQHQQPQSPPGAYASPLTTQGDLKYPRVVCPLSYLQAKLNIEREKKLSAIFWSANFFEMTFSCHRNIPWSTGDVSHGHGLFATQHG